MAVKTYPFLRDISHYFPFFLYGSISLLGTIFLYLYLPETKDKTLQEIEEYFTRAIKQPKKIFEKEKTPIVISNGKKADIV